MNSKGQKAGANAASCAKFEPQTWRRSLCKNCFKTREQHEASDASAGDATKKDAPNGSAKPLSAEQGKSTKSSPETSGTAAKTGRGRRELKKAADAKQEPVTPAPTTATKSVDKKKTTVKVEQEKLVTKPADKKQDTAIVEQHKTVNEPSSIPREKKKDTIKVDTKKTVADTKKTVADTKKTVADTKKTVADTKLVVAKGSASVRDETPARDDGPSTNKPLGSTGGVCARAPDGEKFNTSGDAVGNRKAGVAGGGDTGTGPPQVLGVGQHAEISTDRTPRQTRQEHISAAEVGSASGSPAGQATDSSTDGSTKTSSPSASTDDDRNRANNERNKRSDDLKSADERKREVDEIVAAVDLYDSPIIRAARALIEEESKTEASSPKTARRSNGSGESDRRPALYYHGPISEQDVDLARFSVPSAGGDVVDHQLAKKELSLARRRRRRRQSADACSIKMDAPGRRMREDAMAEDTRMLVENLRDKVSKMSPLCHFHIVLFKF